MFNIANSMAAIIAQAAPAAPNPVVSFIPFIAIIAIFYFLIIRPQNKRIKDHKAMLEAITRGDTIVTNGGIVGKVKKVSDDELTVDIGVGDVKIVRNMIADVRVRNQPANDKS